MYSLPEFPFLQKQKTEANGKRLKACETECLISGETDSDDEYENKNPYQFIHSLNRMEAEKQLSYEFLSENSDSPKGSAASALTSTSKLCAFGSEEGSVRCSNSPLPRSKFCKFHILNVSSLWILAEGVQYNRYICIKFLRTLRPFYLLRVVVK